MKAEDHGSGCSRDFGSEHGEIWFRDVMHVGRSWLFWTKLIVSDIVRDTQAAY